MARRPSPALPSYGQRTNKATEQSDGFSPEARTGIRLLTAEQAAEASQVSLRQIRRMIKDGTLPVKRFGRAVRIHPKELGL